MFGLSGTSLATLFTIAATLPSLFALPSHVEHDAHDDHEHVLSRRLPGKTWYHSEDHPAYALFKRATSTDGVTYPQVGSPEWRAGYPDPKPDPTKLPQAWTDALNAAVAAGKIPNIAPSTPTGGNPSYGSGNPMGPEICSATYKCRIDGEIWDAPDGVFGVSFDDGPVAGSSDTLYDFLQQTNTPATHFMIGINILNNPTEFTRAFQGLNGDIAVHTWTHPYMTTLTNEQLLGEFGWTMEIIHNSTGGRLPQYWRPPYGDTDVRVSAIAKEVFGLTTVIWNQDTEDWSIGNPNGPTLSQVGQSLTKWIDGPKSPGLIILEHELSNNTVSAFMTAFPQIQRNGWKMTSVAQLGGGSAYQNADGDDGTVTPVTGVLAFNNDQGISSSSSVSSASGASLSSTASSSTHSASGSAPAFHASSTTGSSTSSPLSPTSAAQQTSGASRMFGFDVSSILAPLLTLFVSLFALP